MPIGRPAGETINQGRTAVLMHTVDCDQTLTIRPSAFASAFKHKCQGLIGDYRLTLAF